MEKVSILMPVYNAQDFVAQALDSVLTQDYRNIQIVVSDDCSTDLSAAIIRDYVDKYPDKIKAIYNEKNLGITKNCNLVLKHCDGEYIALFAGDDLMYPEKITKQVALMQQHPDSSICYHKVEVFDSMTNQCLFVTAQSARENIENLSDLLLKLGIPGGCSVMVRKSAVPLAGFDNRLPSVSDWLFQLEVSTKGSVVKVDEVLAKYRKHRHGASNRSYQLFEESLYALDLFVEKNPHLTDLPALVNRAKARYIAGEAYRQINNDRRLSYELSCSSSELDKGNVKYYFLRIVTWVNLYVPGAAPVIKALAKKNFNFIKRYIA